MFDLAGILLQGPWKPLDELESPELKDLAIRLPRSILHSHADSTVKYILMMENMGSGSQSLANSCKAS